MEMPAAKRLTTNNRMELMAVIHGLEALKRRSQVDLFTDSEYVRQGLMQWMAKWKANGWRRKVGAGGKTGEVKNLELWQDLDQLIAKHGLISTAWPATAGIRKTIAATNWPWRRISGS